MDSELKEALEGLSTATIALNLINEQIGNLKKTDEEIEKKTKELNDHTDDIDEKYTIVEDLIGRATNLLNETKEIAKSFDINKIKNDIIKEVMEKIKTVKIKEQPIPKTTTKNKIVLTELIEDQDNKDNKTQNNNDTKIDKSNYIGKEFKKDQYSYVIKETFGQLNKAQWPLEFNLIKWSSSKEDTYDLRAFSPDHTQCKTGVSFNKNILISLRTCLNNIDINKFRMPTGRKNYEILRTFGIFKNNSNSNLELNLMAYPDCEPRFDLRKWDLNHKTRGKGITLDKNELINLRDILNNCI